MKLRIEKTFPDSRLLWTDGNRTLAARGNRLLSVDALGCARELGTVGAFWERTGARVRVVRHFLRLGVHHLFPLGDGAFLVVLRRRAYRVDASGRVESCFKFPRGNKPAAKGVCVDPNGNVFVAEYALNGDRALPAMLHRSRDGGRTFEIVHEFRPGEVRHYHFVQWDPYGRCLWMGTGDADAECQLFTSSDAGDSWSRIGGGS